MGLLLLRVASGSALIYQGVSALSGGGTWANAVLHSCALLLGVMLLAGLWTPIAAVLAVVATVCGTLSHASPRPQLGSIAVIAAALALLGPGAWSLDAWLYGWREIKIPARAQEPDSPE